MTDEYSEVKQTQSKVWKAKFGEVVKVGQERLVRLHFPVSLEAGLKLDEGQQRMVDFLSGDDEQREVVDAILNFDSRGPDRDARVFGNRYHTPTSVFMYVVPGHKRSVFLHWVEGVDPRQREKLHDKLRAGEIYQELYEEKGFFTRSGHMWDTGKPGVVIVSIDSDTSYEKIQRRTEKERRATMQILSALTRDGKVCVGNGGMPLYPGVGEMDYGEFDWKGVRERGVLGD